MATSISSMTLRRRVVPFEEEAQGFEDVGLIIGDEDAALIVGFEHRRFGCFVSNPTSIVHGAGVLGERGLEVWPGCPVMGWVLRGRTGGC